ncbi:MAG: hypothetical protein NTW30_04090 [Candidatus Aenigmarchaeota archaeon]|nr:hypothetical protein [Candidatus Aenigmarchaeota archaeon]
MGVVFLLGTIIQNLSDRFLDWSWNYLLTSSIIVSFSDLVFVIGIIVGIIFIIVGLKALYSKIERIDNVHVYVFFPSDTLNENKTLEYHKKHFHNKLIVNFKVNPPKAYYMNVDSYGWKMIKKYQDMWASISQRNSEDETFTQKWCMKKGCILIPRVAIKKDLLESNSIGVVSPTFQESR